MNGRRHCGRKITAPVKTDTVSKDAAQIQESNEVKELKEHLSAINARAASWQEIDMPPKHLRALETLGDLSELGIPFVKTADLSILNVTNP